MQGHKAIPLKFLIVFQSVFEIHIAQTLEDMKIAIKSHVYDVIISNGRMEGPGYIFGLANSRTILKKRLGFG